MEFSTLERIVRAMQLLSKEAKDKRENFIKNNKPDMAACAVNEAVGIGKCLGVLINEFPDDMAKITDVTL